MRISVMTNDGIDELREQVFQLVLQKHQEEMEKENQLSDWID